MKITKHQADPEGLIHIYRCIRLLTMGLQNNIVTIWAVTDDKQGIAMHFAVKNDGDWMSADDCANYITSFISNEGEGVWHLIGEPGKVETPQHTGKILL